MPLFVDGNEVQIQDLKNYDVFLQKYEITFEQRNDWLKRGQLKRISLPTSCLYANQLEIVSTGPFDDTVCSLGTDMMTTCHCVVLRHPESKATALGHFDGSATVDGINEMVKSVIKISVKDSQPADTESGFSFELHIVGGFEDDRGLSKELSLELLQAFHSLQPGYVGSLQFHLKTFCCTTLNQRLVEQNQSVIRSPIIFGLGVVIETGELFPAVFEDDAKGPATQLRGVKPLHGPHKMENVYRWEDRQIVLKPFSYGTFSNIDLWLKQPDNIIRKYMSTSPEVEPDNFVSNIRESLQFIRDNPEPMKTIFEDNKPLKYQNENGCWTRISS